MKIRNICILCLRSLWKKNIRSKVLLPVIMLLTAIPIVMYGAAGSLLDMVSEEKAKLYGSYQYIYWDEEKKEDAPVNLPIDEYQTIGSMYVYDRIHLNDGKTAVSGYADEAAVALGHIELKEGQFPKTSDEIALVQSLRGEIAPDAQIGDAVLFNEKKYRLTGIVEDYGRLWVRGERQVKLGMIPVSAFLAKESDSCAYQIYLVCAGLTIMIHEGAEDSFFMNINAASGNHASYYEIPDGFYLLFVICAVLILYHLMIFSREHLNRRITVYGLCGMIPGEISRLIWMETGMIGLAGMISGIVLGNLGGMAFDWMIRQRTGIAVVWRPGIESAVAGSHIFMITMCSQQLFFWFETGKKKENKKTKYRVRDAKRTTWTRLLQIDMRRTKKGIIAGSMLAACVVTVMIYTQVYERFFLKATTHIELDGKMPFDYDYEIAAEAGTFANPEVSDFSQIAFTADSYENNGLSDETLQRLRMIDGIEEIRAYREDNDIWVMMEQDQMDPYLDLSDMGGTEADGHYDTSWPVSLDEIFGYDADCIKVQAKISGYSESELRAYEPYIEEGQINYDKLYSGEEVILMAPTVQIKAAENGGIARKRVNPGTEGAIQNTAWKAGDMITFTELQTDQESDGWIMIDEAKERYRRYDKQVRIAAVIPYHVGWFENQISIGEVYTLLTVNDAFDALGLSAKYNRVRVYLSADADAKAVKAQIYEELKNYPYVILTDYQMELNGYREMNLIIRLFTRVMLFLILGAACICITGQTVSKLRMNRKTYMLLKINGMSSKWLLGQWAAENLIVGILGLIISVPITSLIIWMSFYVSFVQLVTEYQIILMRDMISSALVVICILLISLIPCVYSLRKGNMRESILNDM